jgi:hypothetical protein
MLEDNDYKEDDIDIDIDMSVVSLDTMKIAMMSINNTEGLEVISWNKVYKATQEDKLLVRLIEEVERGIPESSYDLEQELRQYHQYRYSLHVVAGVMCY